MWVLLRFKIVAAKGDDGAVPERDPVWTSWSNAMDAVHVGDMDSAFAEILSTGDDLLLVKFMERTSPIIDQLSTEEVIRVAGEDNVICRNARAAIPEMTVEALEDNGAVPEWDPIWTSWSNAMDAVHVGLSCLSLASKLDEVNMPCMVDLQVGELNPLFEGKVVQRMEVLVMNYLNWNMKTCTPFSFMDYFLKKANSCAIPQPTLIRRSTQIILSTIKGIDFLEFKPSEIVAAVAVHVSRKIHAMDIDKGRAMHCLELIRDLISVGESTLTITSATITTGSIPRSLNGVLNAAFWSYKNENVERTLGSCLSPSHNTKRRKLYLRNCSLSCKWLSTEKLQSFYLRKCSLSYWEGLALGSFYKFCQV